jgi:hypothetical protein
LPLLHEQTRRVPKRSLSVRIHSETMDLLDYYCEFIQSGRHHVVGQALHYAFQGDGEFQAWLAARTELSEKTA